MRIFVCPVSGGAFPIQLGLISELTALHIRPDLVMGSSGGNVASYVGLAANWTTEQIAPIVMKMNSTMFVQSWWPRWLGFMPSWPIGYFKGSIYASGTGSTELFKIVFASETLESQASPNTNPIEATEIWTGTMNRDTGKGQLFCNLKKENARIHDSEYDLFASSWVQKCMPLTYLDGDIELISKITMASAAIPVLVPEQEVFGCRYVDGGTLFSSPLTALKDQVLEFAEDENVHIDYISSFDIETPTSPNSRSLYENGTFAVNELIKSLCINDRLVALDLLRVTSSHSDTLHYATIDGTPSNLSIVEKIRSACSRSVLELYPTKNDCLDLLAFKAEDIMRLINNARVAYKMRFWWLGNTEFDDQLPNATVTRSAQLANYRRNKMASCPSI